MNIQPLCRATSAKSNPKSADIYKLWHYKISARKKWQISAVSEGKPTQKRQKSAKQCQRWVRLAGSNRPGTNFVGQGVAFLRHRKQH